MIAPGAYPVAPRPRAAVGELAPVLPAAAIDALRDVVGDPKDGAQVRVVRVLERLSQDEYRLSVDGRQVTVRLAGESLRALAMETPGAPAPASSAAGRVSAPPAPEGQAPGALPASATSLASAVEALGANPAVASAPVLGADADTRISGDGRQALALGPGAGAESHPASLDPLVMVVDAPGAADRLAGELAGRIVRSGLFYESHLADWAQGLRPREDLQREPQAHFSPAVLATHAEPEATIPGLAVRRPEGEALGWLPPAPLEPLVREQLYTLERQEARFALPLEGHPAELVVGQERPDGPGGAPGAWVTRLRLSGQTVSIELEAASAVSAGHLEEEANALRQRLNARQLGVSRLDVRRA